MKAATKLFAERGFDATSTNSIAEEARVPSGLLFYHFDTKEALLDEIFKESEFELLIARIFDELAEEPPAVALKTAAVQVLRWLNNNEDRGRLFFKEMTSHRPLASRLRDSRRRNIRRVAAYLDAAIKRKEMAPANTRVLGQIFVSSLLLATLFDHQVNGSAFARTLADTIVGAGKRRKAP